MNNIQTIKIGDNGLELVREDELSYYFNHTTDKLEEERVYLGPKTAKKIVDLLNHEVFNWKHAANRTILDPRLAQMKCYKPIGIYLDGVPEDVDRIVLQKHFPGHFSLRETYGDKFGKYRIRIFLEPNEIQEILKTFKSDLEGVKND